MSDDIPRQDRKLPVSTRALRNIRYLVEKASRGVHSEARMVRADKLPILKALAGAKAELDKILQLDMFSPDQLE